VTFADLIRFAREQHQLTQAELARRCGVQAPVIAVWERGHRAMSERTMEKVAWEAAWLKARMEFGEIKAMGW
jgi:transcriptional regulator with XRE-family HTH domain